MFPPLCLPAASGEFFTEEQSRRIEESHDYEIKFAIFEALQGLFGGNDTNGSDIADDTDSEDTENDFARISVFGVMSGTFQ